MGSLRIGLACMRCEKWGIEANLAATRDLLADAGHHEADMLCLPEASLTGYVDPERYPGLALRVDGPEVAQLVALTAGSPVSLIAGLVEANDSGLPLLTQIVAREGQLAAVYRKRTIPAEEAHLYAPGDSPTVLDLPQARIGLAICADIEDRAVFADCTRLGAQVVFECAAPGLYGDQATRDWSVGYQWWRGECHTKLATFARELCVTIAVATQAGRTRDEDFPGGAFVFAPDGTCVASTKDWSEGVLYAEIAL
jgi:predicted amidohydrolase